MFFSLTTDPLMAHHALLELMQSVVGLAYGVVPLLAAVTLGSLSVHPSLARLRHTADKISSRMQSLRLNETEMSERCSLAAVHIFENDDTPSLTRDRLSKILMNRRNAPAKSAARIITHAEMTVLAHVLGVSIEWLVGQDENRDPVVWNVLASPDRVSTFAHLLQEHEQLSDETTVWSKYPMHSYTNEGFVHAFNQVHYGGKLGIANRPLVEFYNSVARLRRKWILRSNRSFTYSNLIYSADFEAVTCGVGPYSAISRSIRKRNLGEIIEIISNPALKLKLIILRDDASVRDAFQGYEILATMDSTLSVWSYHNADIGWSEHPTYVKPHRQLLERLMSHALCRDVNETVQFIESLQSRLR